MRPPRDPRTPRRRKADPCAAPRRSWRCPPACWRPPAPAPPAPAPPPPRRRAVRGSCRARAVAACLLATACTGQSGSGDASGGGGGGADSLRYLIGQLEDADELTRLEEHLADFEESSGIDVEVQQLDTDTMRTVLQTPLERESV